jgi:hypothetical protein
MEWKRVGPKGEHDPSGTVRVQAGRRKPPNPINARKSPGASRQLPGTRMLLSQQAASIPACKARYWTP